MCVSIGWSLMSLSISSGWQTNCILGDHNKPSSQPPSLWTTNRSHLLQSPPPPPRRRRRRRRTTTTTPTTKSFHSLQHSTPKKRDDPRFNLHQLGDVFQLHGTGLGSFFTLESHDPWADGFCIFTLYSTFTKKKLISYYICYTGK